MNCLGSLIKYIMFLFNLVFLVCGILLIVLGSLILSDIKGITDVQSAFNIAAIPIIIVILGAAIFIIAFFGCCGAIRENKCCMTTYSVFIFLLFALQVTLVVWIFVKRQEFLKAMDDVVVKAWDENDTVHGYPMDFFQISFKCCGLNKYTDYELKSQSVPTSCCSMSRAVMSCPVAEYEYRPGCKDAFVDFWSSKMNIIRYSGIGIALVELIAFIFSCVLISGFRSK